MRSRIRNFISDTVLLLRSVPSSVVTLFVLSVVLMNLLANKTIYQKGFLAVDGGIVVSWVCFLCMDIITKRFGPRAATQVSIFALVVNLFTVGIFAVVSIIPTETIPATVVITMSKTLAPFLNLVFISIFSFLLNGDYSFFS